MKTNLLFIATIFLGASLMGQDHNIINFAGVNAEPETVLVKNLTQDTELTMLGNQTLHLMIKGVWVDELPGLSENNLVIYPNPFEHSCNIEFVNVRNGRVAMHLYGITGKLLHDFTGELTAGMHTFLLSGVPAGSYLLKVQTSTSLLSGKFVVSGQSKSAFSLQHTNQVPLNSSLDGDTGHNPYQGYFARSGRSVVEMDFWPGDQMLFVGIADGFDNIGIYDTPDGNQTYTFEFTNWWPIGYEHCFVVPTAVVEVTNPTTGKIWMDRNLGASRVATASDDADSYGDLYQWGRFADGHQCRDSETTTTLSTTNQPGHGSFITINSSPYDWRNPPNNNLWQGVYGINNPCPDGFRLATDVELDSERLNWISGNAEGAFASPLKLPMAAARSFDDGGFPTGFSGAYWSSTVSGTTSRRLFFDYFSINLSNNFRGFGLSVRCIKADSPPLQPSPINGEINPCENQTGLFYSVTSVPGESYYWTVPTDWNITAGQGTHQITVTVGSGGGIIEVTPSNHDGNGPSQTLAVTTHSVPVQPSVMAGETNPCVGTTQSYSVTEVTGVTYSWSVPPNWSITSGQGTNELTVTVVSSAGTIEVTPSNVCGDGPSQTLAVTTRTVPAQPSTITGETNPCEGSTETYSVTLVSGVDYDWTVPAGWSITGGQGTYEITVIVGSAAGNIEVTPSNVCGDGPSQTITVSTQTVPEQPSEISGDDNPCQSSTETYSVTQVTGVAYTWSVPEGWTISGGQGTHEISVTVGSAAGNIEVTPSNVCGDGPSQTIAVSTQTVPERPSAIAGEPNPCEGAMETYGVTQVTGINYDWSVPVDWNITGGQGTHQITVTVGLAAGNIEVTPSNDCGNGPLQTLAVTTQTVPERPSAIAGEPNPCEGATEAYGVTQVTGINYDWSVPADWIITGGQGTHEITVAVGSATGDIEVVPSNDCGNGPLQTLAVTTQTVPERPLAIAGEPNPCEGATEAYGVTQVTGINYDWSVPSDWIITDGQGTHEITVAVGSATGDIEVVPSNDCGNGPLQTLAVTTQTIPAQPSDISGETNPCLGSMESPPAPPPPGEGDNSWAGPLQAYSVTDEGFSYTWTLPPGWVIISGQGTSMITVGVGAVSGFIEVIPSNICGNGAPRTLAVTPQTFPAQPSAITGEASPCLGTTQSYSVTEVEGVSYAWTVPVGWSITGGQGTYEVTVSVGSGDGLVMATPSNVCGNGTSQTLAVTTQTIPATATEGTHLPDTDEIEWHWNTVTGATGYKLNTTNDYASADDMGILTSHTETGLLCSPCGISYTRYVWAYNDCGVSGVLVMTANTNACSTAVVEVTNPTTSKTWMDRNMGAARLATSSTDAAAYGDLYQWGRFSDGHQCRISETTTTLSDSDTPGHPDFILAPNSPNDWRSPKNDDLWQGLNGVNNPCPEGFRVPTQSELIAERNSWDTYDTDGAFGSLLKLTASGRRTFGGGAISNVESDGYYWSSTIADAASLSRILIFNISFASLSSFYRANGLSVRCIKDEPEAPTITTSVVSEITPFSATSGGNVTDDGGALITTRGVVWGKTLHPTIYDNDGITTDGDGLGVFVSSITGLDSGTTYHVRAYATNDIGPGYGENLSFSTQTIPDGVFVSLDGNDSNPGSHDFPKISIQAGIDQAHMAGKDVYVATGTYNSNTILLANGVSVYGGYDPLTWQFDASNQVVIAYDGSVVSERIVGMQGADISSETNLQFLTIQTPNGAGSGVSNYGIHLSNSGGLHIKDCTIIAGDGSDGAAGGSGTDGLAGNDGSDGLAGDCDKNVNALGGAGGSPGPGSAGGAGGLGRYGNTAGNNGSAGSGVFGGLGGVGGAANGCDGGQNGEPGSIGAYGINGIDGEGGNGGGLLAGFWVSSNGQAGTSGSTGYGGGGGGGGGGQGGLFCIDGTGNGGGGGGAGGGAGSFGSAGRGGGGSFGLFLVSSTGIQLSGNSICSGDGGVGGAGASGGCPGAGGAGGQGASVCTSEVGAGGDGGAGGRGGRGGHGGGGAGGPSYALFMFDTTPVLVGNSLMHGNGGSGGNAASNDCPIGGISTGKAGTTGASGPQN